MRVIVSETAARLLDERRMRVPPDLDIVFMRGDGTIDGDTAVALSPEIAWATGDLFFYGDGRSLQAWGRMLFHSDTLRWFQSPAAGWLAIYEPLLARGVRITSAHENYIPIAEYMLRAVLTHFQRAHEWTHAQRAHLWRPHEFREVYETTWLVVGLGAIGGAVAERARAFGARVIGVRRHPTGREQVDEMLTPEKVLGVLRACDVVVLAAPATSETAGLVDAEFLDAMKPGSVLVNVARGALVDEAALLAALDRGRPEAAILDVFATEPLPIESAFWDHPRVIVTPHSSAGGLARHGRLADLFVENLASYRAGEPMRHEIAAPAR